MEQVQRSRGNQECEDSQVRVAFGGPEASMACAGAMGTRQEMRPEKKEEPD